MLVLADLQADGQIQSLGTTDLDKQAIDMLTDVDIRLLSKSGRPPACPLFASIGLYKAIS